MVLDNLVTYFYGGVFGQPDLMRGLLGHFMSNVKWNMVREAHKREGSSNGEMMEDLLIELKHYSP